MRVSLLSASDRPCRGSEMKSQKRRFLSVFILAEVWRMNNRFWGDDRRASSPKSRACSAKRLFAATERKSWGIRTRSRNEEVSSRPILLRPTARHCLLLRRKGVQFDLRGCADVEELFVLHAREEIISLWLFPRLTLPHSFRSMYSLCAVYVQSMCSPCTAVLYTAIEPATGLTSKFQATNLEALGFEERTIP